jgi:pSer/pThr/pTyr-binding forkhead associated (FHA) protein
MRDGLTKQQKSLDEGRQGIAGWTATLVEVAGGAEGTEHPVDVERVVVGRGPDADLVFDDDEMSAQHACFEHTRGGFCVTDLGSTNGTRVNGESIGSRVLAHGDRVELGGHVFHLLLEKREKPPRTWLIDD